MDALKQVRISLGALRHNFARCRELAAGAGLIALVKADAYGHGMVDCARFFAELGAAGLSVADAVEGEILREAGLRLPIYVHAGLAPQSVPGIVANRLTPLVSDVAMLEALSVEAGRQGKTLDIHLKVDVGMGRQGALPGDFIAMVKRALELPHLHIGGLMAHLPKADDRKSGHSARLAASFALVTDEALSLIPYPCVRHLANSGGLLYVPGTREFDLMRPGIALYGCYPDGADGREQAVPPHLRPAMSWVATVLLVRDLPAGHTVGYDCTYTTTRPTRMAVLPVGYSDGYLRKIAGRGQVLIGGKRAPVLGRISMNQTVVDVTDIPDVRAGDEAVLLGRQGGDEITAEELAGWMETINYEALCLIGRLNQRISID